MKRLLLFIFFASCILGTLFSQSTVKEMKAQVGELQSAIKQKEKILLSSEKDVKSKLQNLQLLTAQMGERKSYINALLSEIKSLERHRLKIIAEIQEMEKRLSATKSSYAEALRHTKRNGSFQEKLLFVISASDFNAMWRRYRYTREYMNAHRKLAGEITDQIASIKIKKNELDSLSSLKQVSLEEQQREQDKLKLQQSKQQGLIAELEREQGKVKKELERQRKDLARLNSAIDRAIEREMELERARAAATSSKKRDAVANNKKSKAAEKVGQGEKYHPGKEAQKLSGSFLQNKGKLPVPITGPYVVVGRFGPQKGVAGRGNVQIDYGGITLQAEQGAKARAVFDGYVSSVVNSKDFSFVLVRHGNYITVYCRLNNIRVKVNDEVKTGTILGDVATDVAGHTTLLFQIRQEKTKLNPLSWLKI